MSDPMLSPEDLAGPKYLFFTGKGGVGKTSTSCAVAVALADAGRDVLIVSTDPASNLEDVFGQEIGPEPTPIRDCEHLWAQNVDPVEEAARYRESVIGPYRGLLPDDALANVEEQLSGSCTVEIAAFDRFVDLVADPSIGERFDTVIFDTAPTGHTLRLLSLPSAWTSYLNENTTGTSCLGQLSGMGEKRDSYDRAVATLKDPSLTALVLVSRPQTLALEEADRSARELAELGIEAQLLVVNGIVPEGTGDVSRAMHASQAEALESMPARFESMERRSIPLRAYDVTGVPFLREFLSEDQESVAAESINAPSLANIDDLIEDLAQSGRRVIMTMGKGGVGKTTVAVAIAQGLAGRDIPVLLSTTDPADHLDSFDLEGISVSHIDEAGELERYREEVLEKARATMGPSEVAYVEEDLRSPCTQEIATFRAFADIVAKADDEVVVIDTAPTGHTILLLESTQSYGTQIEHTGGDVPQSVRDLLPRIKDPSQTDVVIVSLPEATPVLEAERLQQDLSRAGIPQRWWVANQCLSLSGVEDPLLQARASAEQRWIERAQGLAERPLVGIAWESSEA